MFRDGFYSFTEQRPIIRTIKFNFDTFEISKTIVSLKMDYAAGVIHVLPH